MVEDSSHDHEGSTDPRTERLITPIGEREFDRIITDPDKTVIIEFYSTACASCLVMRKMLLALVHRRPDEFVVYSVNANYHDSLSRRLRIGGTPTVLVFRKGIEVGRIQGVVPWSRLLAAVS